MKNILLITAFITALALTLYVTQVQAFARAYECQPLYLEHKSFTLFTISNKDVVLSFDDIKCTN